MVCAMGYKGLWVLRGMLQPTNKFWWMDQLWVKRGPTVSTKAIHKLSVQTQKHLRHKKETIVHKLLHIHGFSSFCLRLEMCQCRCWPSDVHYNLLTNEYHWQ